MRILMLTHRLPYAPNRGDRIRAHFLLRELASEHEVHLASLVHSEDEARHVGDLDGIARSVTIGAVPRRRNRIRAVARLAGRTPLTHLLLDSPGFRDRLAELARRVQPELVFVFCTGVAHLALDPPLRDIPAILDLVDVDSLKWKSLGQTSAWPLSTIYRREARLLGEFERTACNHAQRSLVVNDRELEGLEEVAPGARSLVVPNGIDSESFRPSGPPSERPRVVFTGVMSYRWNEDAAVRLASRILPLVRDAVPDAELCLVGAQPTRRVKALDNRSQGIEVTGTVARVEPYLWDSAVAAAPLRVARGVQNKVLEAVAAGLPSVITSAVAEGLPPELAPACTVADDDHAIAAELIRLLRMPAAQRRAIAESTNFEPLRWRCRLSPIHTAISELVAPKSRCL